MSELLIRSISAIAMMFVALAAAAMGGYYFAILVAAAATLIVRAVLGPPEGENKFEIQGYSVVQVDPQVSDLALATR